MKKIKEQRQVYPKWSHPARRLILYADVMGFKSRVATVSHEELTKQLEKFRTEWDNKMSPFIKHDHYIKFVQFSDSMLIVVNGTDDKMFNLISKAAVSLMQVAIKQLFPIKGVIAEGTFTFNEERQLYFGQPLVDAAVLHDQLKYYGIAVHHTAEHTVRSKMSESNPYSSSPIYIEKGKVSHYHLCWNLLNEQYSPIDYTDICVNRLDMIAETVSGEPRLYIDHTKEILNEDKELFVEINKVVENTEDKQE